MSLYHVVRTHLDGSLYGHHDDACDDGGCGADDLFLGLAEEFDVVTTTTPTDCWYAAGNLGLCPVAGDLVRRRPLAPSAVRS